MLPLGTEVIPVDRFHNSFDGIKNDFEKQKYVMSMV